jgi:hypothetical protein
MINMFSEETETCCVLCDRCDIVALYSAWWSSLRGTIVVNRLDTTLITNFDIAAMLEHDGNHMVLYTGGVKNITYFIARVIER